MALRPVIVEGHNPLQRAVVRHRRQLRAVIEWLSDLEDGQDRIALKAYCERNGVTTRGIKKVLASPKVQELIRKVYESTATEGTKLTTSLLLKRLEQEGDGMTVAEIVKTGEHLARLSSGAYAKEGEKSPTVAVQINLPAVPGYDRESRGKVIDVAVEKLEGLV